jgi:hypothetical protein
MPKPAPDFFAVDAMERHWPRGINPASTDPDQERDYTARMAAMQRELLDHHAERYSAEDQARARRTLAQLDGRTTYWERG